jgi:hypothetical protein
MNKVLAGTSNDPLVSVFYRDHDPGGLYFEVHPSVLRAQPSLVLLLNHVTHVSFLGSNKSCLTFVPLNDCVALLRPSNQWSVCETSSWVHLAQGSHHHNDLGFVICVDGDTVETLFIPQISLNPGTGGRPPLSLFNYGAVKDVHGSKSV